jgi:hypothetical protein
VLELREQRLLERVGAVVAAQMHGSSTGGAAGVTAAAAAAAAGGGFVPRAGDMQAAAGVGGHGGHGGVAAAAPPANIPLGQAANKQPAERKGFPELSTHKTLVELAEWYYINTLDDTGRTPQQLEAAGKADKQQWRGGDLPRSQSRFQRWAEYEQLLRKIEQCREQLDTEQRRGSINPHRLAAVDVVTAARELDRQRVRLGLTVSEYRQYAMGCVSSKGYRKGKEAEERLQQEEQEAAAAAAAGGGGSGGGGGAAAAGGSEQQQQQQQQQQQLGTGTGQKAKATGRQQAVQQPQQQSAMQRLLGINKKQQKQRRGVRK